MDVTVAAEPAETRRLRELLAQTRARLSVSQTEAMTAWHVGAPHDGAVVSRLRQGVSLDALRACASKLGYRRAGDVALDERAGALAQLWALGEQRPAALSALVWSWFGAEHPGLATILIHVLRERAELPGLRYQLGARVAPVASATWFADQQLEDAARWIEYVPAPAADTLAATVRAIEEQRASAGRVELGELVPFLQRAAAFFTHVAAAGVDPLGFALAREGRLEIDPARDRRLELATWARRAGHSLCVRGQLAVLRIDVSAPWPLAIELIAAELGRGVSGAMGLLLRLEGPGPVPPAPMAPVLLCLPEEPIEELGPRFERWLQRAYPHAVGAWRVWS